MIESLTQRFKTICIFDSIEFGKNKEYLREAAELGITLAAQKIDLVFKRGSLRLRSIVTVSTNIRDNRVLGIMLKALAIRRYVTRMTIGNELKVLNMHERMTYINHNTDVYITLLRGLEILKDIFNIALVLNLKFIKIH